MSVEWFDEELGEGLADQDEETEAFYCPYTNAARCAIMEKGWQVQELCETLECEQLKFFRHSRPRRHKAA